MYIDFSRLLRQFGVVIGILLMVYGLLSYIFSPTALQQSTGVLLAIFGLLLTWMALWLKKK